MAEVRDLIRRRLADMGLSMKEASERIGRNHAYLQQYFERGVPASLPEDVREKTGCASSALPRRLALRRTRRRHFVSYAASHGVARKPGRQGARHGNRRRRG
jgi:hypothetical protein